MRQCSDEYFTGNSVNATKSPIRRESGILFDDRLGLCIFNARLNFLSRATRKLLAQPRPSLVGGRPRCPSLLPSALPHPLSPHRCRGASPGSARVARPTAFPPAADPARGDAASGGALRRRWFNAAVGWFAADVGGQRHGARPLAAELRGGAGWRRPFGPDRGRPVALICSVASWRR